MLISAEGRHVIRLLLPPEEVTLRRIVSLSEGSLYAAACLMRRGELRSIPRLNYACAR